MNMEEIENLRKEAQKNIEGKVYNPKDVVLKFVDSEGNEQVVHDSLELRRVLDLYPNKATKGKNVGTVGKRVAVSVGHVIPGDAVPKEGVQRIERSGHYLRGGERNKPCPCGSGLKAKRCPCDRYEV